MNTQPPNYNEMEQYFGDGTTGNCVEGELRANLRERSETAHLADRPLRGLLHVLVTNPHVTSFGQMLAQKLRCEKGYPCVGRYHPDKEKG